MINELLMGNADLGLSGTADILERRDVVEFNVPMYKWRFVAVFLHPTLRRDNFAIVKPFDEYLWFAILASIAAFTLAITIVEWVYEQVLRPCFPKPAALPMTREEGPSSLWTMNFLCCKSIPLSQADLPVMMIMICGFMLGFVLNVTYTAMIFSFLSVPSKSYTSLDELLKKSFQFDRMPSPIINVLQVKMFSLLFP